jgi:hypothetical protein
LNQTRLTSRIVLYRFVLAAFLPALSFDAAEIVFESMFLGLRPLQGYVVKGLLPQDWTWFFFALVVRGNQLFTSAFALIPLVFCIIGLFWQNRHRTIAIALMIYAIGSTAFKFSSFLLRIQGLLERGGIVQPAYGYTYILHGLRLLSPYFPVFLLLFIFYIKISGSRPPPSKPIQTETHLHDSLTRWLVASVAVAFFLRSLFGFNAALNTLAGEQVIMFRPMSAIWLGLLACTLPWQVVLLWASFVMRKGRTGRLLGILLLADLVRVAVAVPLSVLHETTNPYSPASTISYYYSFRSALNSAFTLPYLAMLPWARRPARLHVRAADGETPGPSCFICGYYLHGLTGTACPECGTPITNSQQKKPNAD